MRKFFLDIFTEANNTTFDVARVLAVISILGAIILAFVNVVYKNAPFSIQDYGVGMGALFGGVGVALGLKKDSN